MTERTGRPWLNYMLGALCVGAIVAAVLVVGPSAGGQAATRRTAKAVEGVVQSTVSGSGNLQPASQLNLGFKTSGTITRIYVTQGEHVSQGRLLAELDPSSAEVTLEQSRASLQAAEAKLAKEEETNGEGSGGSSSAAPSASAASVADEAGTTVTETTSPNTTRRGAQTEPSQSRGSGSQSKGSSSESEDSTTAKATVSTATREANLASARAAVKSDALTVRTDEEALASTKLYAPASGTIVSLAGQVGEVVSASGTTRSSSASSSSSSGSSGSASSGRSATGSSGTGSSSTGSGTGSSSSSAFAVLADLSSMQLVAPLSQSEVGEMKAGQIATVTVEALEGHKLAAHVGEVATLSTSSSGVVSYDVTFQLDQMDSGVKPGMSATAEVVVKQAEGVNVPTSAITGGSVTVVSGGKDVRRRVVTGLAGNSSTIVLSGLTAGETVVLPAATSTKSSTSLTSKLGRLAGGGGGGGFGGGGGGGAVFFRGGG
ncbi:MAG TPA: biotin/lipoyl-binding protein [Solirubrobacteraceae bacterium]|jgi:multidrug efflux pump subunit AcrA (membrane-fusion protein)